MLPANNHRRFAAICLYVGLTLVFFLIPRAHAAKLRVDVQGVERAVHENVMSHLSINQEQSTDLAPSRIRRLHENASEEIRTALQPFGYYRPRITATLDHDESGWTARYKIEPGEPVRASLVDVQVTGEGKDDLAFVTLVNRFPLKPGEPLVHSQYEQAKRDFQRVAAERGYFDHRFARHEVAVDLEKYEARVYLHADTGRRYRFGEIRIEQELLDPELMRRYVRMSPGDPYSTAVLLDVQTALSGTDFFGNIEIIANPQDARDYAVPIHIRLTPRKPSKYTFGIGYGTDTGVRGNIGWERRYLNDRGHHLRTELRGSEIERSFNAGYFIPTRNPRTDQFAFTAGYTENDINNIDSKVRRLAISRTVSRGQLQETLSLTNQNEDFAIGSETGTSHLLLPGVTWSYVWGKERVYVRNGARVSLDLHGASSKVASDASLFQSRLDAKGIYSIANFGRLIARGELGATQIDDFHQLPASLRFFTGGDATVRGYDYKSLGPQDAEGTVTGGKYLLVGSIEYEQRLTNEWAAAAFYDVGDAFNEFPDSLKKGIGIGLRWRSPVGQIRVDVGSARSLPDHPFRLHISIGPDL